MAGRVCIVGSVNMDLVVRAPRLPAPGETIAGGPFKTFPGGKGANQAVAAARMGAAVSFVGRLGTDAYGTELRSVLSREGVDITALRATAGESSGVALITVAEGSGENTIVVVGGANAKLTAADIQGVSGFIRLADVLLMQLEVPVETAAAAAGIAHLSGRKVLLNAAPARDVPDELLGSIDVLIVNAVEAAHLAGVKAERSLLESDPVGTARLLLERGPGAVVVTLGPAGALVAEGDAVRRVRSIEVEAVDTVGAGDAFCGCLAAMLAEGKSLVDAARVGCVAGALAATKAGAIPSLPQREAVRERLKQQEA
ncbi:MAG: ribokinase [Phycisphaerales bacterium]|jgi:ribokinase|nr:ribokinase [Phycisphaerales bacterium]